MKKSKDSVTDIKIKDIKNFIQDFKMENKENIYLCFTMKSLLKYISQQKNIYNQALEKLYACNTYEQLEDNLIMMNKLFKHDEFQYVKKDLYIKLINKPMTLQIYQVIRHLFDSQDFLIFLKELESKQTSLLTIAKICLIEDEYELAYQYLKRMDSCHDESLLDLLCEYSPWLYCQLEYSYHFKKRQALLYQKLS